MSEPQSLAAILAGPMSRLDGCPTPSCVNTETPRAAIPIAGGWRASYLCADCGCAWTADWAESPVTEGDSRVQTWENGVTWREPDRANESGSLTAHRLTRNERG